MQIETDTYSKGKLLDKRFERMHLLSQHTNNLSALIVINYTVLSCVFLSLIYLSIRSSGVVNLIGLYPNSQFWTGKGPLVVCAIFASWQIVISVYRLLSDKLIYDLFQIVSDDLDLAQASSNISSTNTEQKLFEKAQNRIELLAINNNLRTIMSLIGSFAVLSQSLIFFVLGK